MARLNYLDNLKVMLTFLVIFHHAGQAYGDGGEWGYTPSNPEEVMPWIWHFFSTNAAFFMGLYFFISGYFVPGSYDRQGFGTFIRKKILRLGVPLLLLGTAFLCLALFVENQAGRHRLPVALCCIFSANALVTARNLRKRRRK